MRRLLVFVRLGFRSIGKLGIISFLCFALSFTLLSFAFRDFTLISEEKAQPCTVIAHGASITQEQSAAAREIDGVVTSTSVIVLPSQLVIGDYTRDLTVYAVESEWIDGISQGEVFTESSAMPYIVLSEKALEGFKDKTGKTVFSDSVDWQNSEASLNGFYGNICGIAADEDSAVGYISHSAAEAMLLFNGEIPAYTQIWLKLKSSAYEESVTSELAVMGLAAASQDSTKWQTWKTDTRNAVILCISGAVILLAAAAIVREKLKQDMLKNKSEYLFLVYMGIQKHDFTTFLVSRIILTCILSFIVSTTLFFCSSITCA